MQTNLPAAPAPDKARRACVYAGRNRHTLALRPVYARYGAEDRPEPEDRYHAAPVRNAYTEDGR